jgi:hypothetical protein
VITQRIGIPNFFGKVMKGGRPMNNAYFVLIAGIEKKREN